MTTAALIRSKREAIAAKHPEHDARALRLAVQAATGCTSRAYHKAISVKHARPGKPRKLTLRREIEKLVPDWRESATYGDPNSERSQTLRQLAGELEEILNATRKTEP